MNFLYIQLLIKKDEIQLFVHSIIRVTNYQPTKQK